MIACKAEMQEKIKTFLNTPALLLLIVAAALVLRVFFFVGIGFNDDSYYLEHAEKIYKGLEFSPHKYIWDVRIGVYLPVVVSWKIFGISEFSTSLPFVLYSLGIVIVTYFLGKVLFNDRVGLTASFLISFFPLDVIYATQVGPDVPFQLFSALAVVSFFCYCRLGRRYKLYAWLTGAWLGIAYLFKEMVLLVLACFAFSVFCEMVANKRRVTFLIHRKVLLGVLLFLAGFLIVHCIQNVYLYKLSGEWFFGEKAKAWTLRHDGNRNDDYALYPRAMLNRDRGRFEWLHSKPLLGFIYYFVLIGTITLVLQRGVSKNTLFVIFWLVLFFLFFQYGLTFISTSIIDNGMRPRHLRFLLPLSIPAALIIAQAASIQHGRMHYVKIALLIFFMVTSLYYTYQSKTFLRNGMGYLRETVHYLITREPKSVYIPDCWTLSKFKFFSAYNETFLKKLIVYECSAISCTDSFYDKGDYIRDAYVVTRVSPYTYINTRSRYQKTYPSFMLAPPAHWELLKTIHFDNYGIFAKFTPKLYYAP